MISEVNLSFKETVNLLDDLFPWLCWKSCLEDILQGDPKGLPRVKYTIHPDGPKFHLANVASFVLKFARMESWSSTDLIEYMLESVVHKKRLKRNRKIDDVLDNLLGDLKGKVQNDEH